MQGDATQGDAGQTEQRRAMQETQRRAGQIQWNIEQHSTAQRRAMQHTWHSAAQGDAGQHGTAQS